MFHKITISLLTIITVLWIAAFGLWMYVPLPPVINWRNDSVTPAEIKIGGTVSVSRSFTVTRDDDIMVVRAIVSGDCRKLCEIIDLPEGRFKLEPGEYNNVIRDHVIPATAGLGTWRLVFRILWNDTLGRTISTPLPELTFNVVE